MKHILITLILALSVITIDYNPESFSMNILINLWGMLGIMFATIGLSSDKE